MYAAWLSAVHLPRSLHSIHQLISSSKSSNLVRTPSLQVTEKLEPLAEKLEVPEKVKVNA